MSGVSVRTLHYYDEEGILEPSAVTEAGYRLYDDTAIERLQMILFYKELDFSLKDIKRILDSGDFDREAILSAQIELLKLKKERLEKIISLAQNIKDLGVDTMDFSAFDKKKIEEYRKEASEKWGNTQAFREFEEKEAENGAYRNDKTAALMSVFAKFGKVKEDSPECEEAQELVAELQSFITKNFYACTPEILASLGQMYAGDERFKANIDKAGGEGTANFAAKAIEIFIKL